MANCQWYQQSLVDCYIKADILRVHVLAMNYRGTDRFWSPWPSCKEDIIEDVDAGVRFLLDLGVQPKHILMDGLSMGGATATQVAAKHQEPGNAMPALIQNTFSSLESVAFIFVKNFLKLMFTRGNSENTEGSHPIRDFLSIPLLELPCKVSYFSLSAIKNFITLHPIESLKDVIDVAVYTLFYTALMTVDVAMLILYLCRVNTRGWNKGLNTWILDRENYFMQRIKDSTTVKSCISLLLKSTGWDFDNVAAYQKLQGLRLVTYSPEDSVIPASASLAHALPERTDVYELGSDSNHCTTLFSKNPAKYKQFVKNALNLSLIL
jgi:hypothetical protein